MDDAARLLSGEAWAEWCERLKATGQRILGDEFPGSPHARAEGFRWLTRLLTHANQLEIEAGDPRHPRFVRYETPDTQWGGPNPDNTYLRARIDPALAYRVWADVRGVRQAILSLHEGEMQFGELGVYSERSLDELHVGADGRLEVTVSPEPGAGNHLEAPPRARLLTVRIFQSDWERDAAPAFHIERVGAEGEPPPPLEPDELARALARSARWIEETAGFWNGYTRAAWERGRPNVAAAPRPAPGGADHILYGSCLFELGDEDALLVECEAPDADYWGFTIHTLGWLESGSFAERQTSLSDRQAHVDPDGRVRLVVSHRDPGAPNWIDTEGRTRGMLVQRVVWARSRPQPTSRVVPLRELRDVLPPGHPVVDAAARRRALARRREAAWNRFL